jgi:hypothetical protein
MQVVEALRRLPGHVGADLHPVRVENAILALGPPWSLGKGQPAFAVAAEVAAERLVHAISMTTGTRLHLCPLDCAASLPDWTFGPNRIARLSPGELETLVAPARLLRHSAHWVFDSHRFSQFVWLLVEEPLNLDPRRLQYASSSMFALLSRRMGDIDGRIHPHRAAFPAAVEKALFALLLLPWEDVVRDSKLEWRPFRIPWIYTIDSDPFERPNPPPDPDSLTWTTLSLSASDGSSIEDEVPDQRHLDDAAVGGWTEPNDASWQRLTVALQSPLLNTPIQHFVVRAFVSDGIDEFLAHIVTIEAALGLKLDHCRSRRPHLSDGKNPGATLRLRQRCSNLLNDTAASDILKSLYRVRSDYIHGAHLIHIPETDRLAARRLARRVAAAQVDAAATEPTICRETYLNGLLAGRGAPPL